MTQINCPDHGMTKCTNTISKSGVRGVVCSKCFAKFKGKWEEEGMKYILGVDPGLSGGLALYSKDELLTFEIPTIKVIGKTTKKIINEPELARMIDSWSKDIKFVMIEKVHSMPNQSSVAIFNFGMGYGIIKGIVAANFLPIKYVDPRTWKKNLGVPAEKNKSRLRATELFPAYSDQWRKAMWDGRAEAAMIAYYGSKLTNN